MATDSGEKLKRKKGVFNALADFYKRSKRGDIQGLSSRKRQAKRQGPKSAIVRAVCHTSNDDTEKLSGQSSKAAGLFDAPHYCRQKASQRPLFGAESKKLAKSAHSGRVVFRNEEI
jgi:hypothetical protein